MSTLGGSPARTVDLVYPTFGGWRADVSLIGGPLPLVGSPIILDVADLSLVGHVLRAAYDQPDRPRAVVVGGNGWEGAVTAPISFRSSGGVLLSTVLRDLSRRSGEPIVLPTDRTMGLAFAYPAGTVRAPQKYRDALGALVRFGYLQPHRVDPDGVTRFGARVGVQVTARATDMGSSSNVGVTTYGIDSPLAFLPGNIVGGVVIGRLVVHETAGTLSCDVWAA